VEPGVTRSLLCRGKARDGWRRQSHEDDKRATVHSVSRSGDAHAPTDRLHHD
jgi:hypothetical protein